MTVEPDDGEVVEAELLPLGGEQLPAVPEQARPQYLVDKHTMLGPGELPPTADGGPRYTDQDFRVSAETVAYGEQADAENTQLNRASVVGNFERWCEEEGRVASPCTTATFTEYGTVLMKKGLKATTIRTYMSLIRTDQPKGDRPDNAPFLERLRAYRRANARVNRRREAFPLTLPYVLPMIGACDESTPIGKRDAALLAFGYRFLARRIELADLEIGDLTITDTQIVVWLAKDKTHQDEDQVKPQKNRADLRQVERMRAWLAVLAQQGVTSGPLFRALTKSGKLATRTHATRRGDFMTGNAVNDIVQKRFRQAGLQTDGRPVSAHGLRAGGATDLAAAGVSERELATEGRWDPDSQIPGRRYVRPAREAGTDVFDQVPVHGEQLEPEPPTTDARAAARRRRVRRV